MYVNFFRKNFFLDEQHKLFDEHYLRLNKNAF